MSSWKENVRSVEPYTPGEQPQRKDIIKLHTNENPYPPSPAVEEALRAFDVGRLRKYPTPDAAELVSALSEVYGLPKEQIYVGVGSDDVLAMSFLTFFNSKKPILFPDVTYSFYDVWADLFKIPYERLPLASDWSVLPGDYLRENGGVVIPNPNAPTGKLLPLSDIEKIVAGNPASVVIIDEAYIDFGGESALPLLSKYENLLVVRTMSKSRSLAGSRIGFAFGNPDLIKYLWDVRNSFNSYTMDSVTQAVGAASLRDRAYFEDTCSRIMKTRERFSAEMKALGFTFPESAANFIFASHPEIDAAKLFSDLKEAGIFVRYFPGPRTGQSLRITIGTDEEMDRLIAFLKEYLKK